MLCQPLGSKFRRTRGYKCRIGTLSTPSTHSLMSMLEEHRVLDVKYVTLHYSKILVLWIWLTSYRPRLHPCTTQLLLLLYCLTESSFVIRYSNTHSLHAWHLVAPSNGEQRWNRSAGVATIGNDSSTLLLECLKFFTVLSLPRFVRVRLDMSESESKSWRMWIYIVDEQWYTRTHRFSTLCSGNNYWLIHQMSSRQYYSLVTRYNSRECKKSTT